MRERTQSAGDNSSLHQAERDINIYHGITYSDAKEIALEVYEKNAYKLTQDAARMIDSRISEFSENIVRQVYETSPESLKRFGDPRFLAALVSAQRSFAETGDKNLSEILTGLVSDLASEPVRTRREIVIRLAIECAPHLTQPQLCALSVVLLLSARLHYVDHFDPLPNRLDTEFRPYYGQLPVDVFDYQYLGSTEAGTFFGSLGIGPYTLLHKRYANVMYPPFRKSELPPEFLRVTDDTEIAQLLSAIPEDRVTPEDEQTKYRLKYETSTLLLNEDFKIYRELSKPQQALRKFIRDRSMKTKELQHRITEEEPALANFLDHVERSQALGFQLSPIGTMLARHEVYSRSPEDAAQIDELFAV